MATWPQVHGAWTEVRSDPGIRQNNKIFPRLGETAKQSKIESVRCKTASGTNQVVGVYATMFDRIQHLATICFICTCVY